VRDRADPIPRACGACKAPSSLLIRCVAVPRSSRRSPLERSISHPLAHRFCSPARPAARCSNDDPVPSPSPPEALHAFGDVARALGSLATALSAPYGRSAFTALLQVGMAWDIMIGSLND